MMNEGSLLLNYIGGDDLFLEKEKNQKYLKNLNSILELNGYKVIKDLYDPESENIFNVISLIRTLLEEKFLLSKQKNEIFEKINKNEIYLSDLKQKYEKAKSKIDEMLIKNKNLELKLENLTKKHKDEIDLFKKEKDELLTINSKLSMKDNQFKHEIKKIELESNELKEKLKRNMIDKETKKTSSTKNLPSVSGSAFGSTSNIGNASTMNFPKVEHGNLNKTFVITETIKNSTQILNKANALREFYDLLYNSLNLKNNYLVQEIDDLKNCLKIIYEEIFNYIETKKLMLMKILNENDKIKKMETKTNFNKKIFEIDFSLSKDEILNKFNEFLNSFRFFLLYDMFEINPNEEFEGIEINDKGIQITDKNNEKMTKFLSGRIQEMMLIEVERNEDEEDLVVNDDENQNKEKINQNSKNDDEFSEIFEKISKNQKTLEKLVSC